MTMLLSLVRIVLFWAAYWQGNLHRVGALKPISSEVYSWVKVEYDWPSDSVKQEFITSGQYVVENNIITGIKVYKGTVFVTVPRWRHGVPSSLNQVVMKNGNPILQPYPSWHDQTLGDCEALQFVQSMEMDPNSGFMWIIDNGRVDFLDNTPAKNNCPPKLIIYDVEENTEVHRYTFPEKVANSTSCFLNDIVLDYIDGQVKFAYISDPSDAKLYVYDYEGDSSYFFQDPSMTPTNPGAFSAINGIAMSAHFDFLYYCPVDGFGLFQVPTTILHNADSDFSQAVRHVGTRPGRSGGLAYGQRNLYYGLLDTNGVNVWHVAHDAQQTGYDHVVMLTQEPLVRDQIKMHWVDSFAWDDSGHLWFTVNNLNKFMDRTMDFSGGSGPNIYVWKIQVNETSYLKQTPLTCLPVG